MNMQLLEAVRRLPVDERVALVEAIWDSVAEDAGLLPVSPEQAAIIEARLAEHRRDPAAGDSWEAVRERLKKLG